MEPEKAFKKLLIKNPFYGLFCLSLPKVITRKHPTLCVTRQGISCCLNINPDFWEQYTDDEQIALLQHELSHIALQHMFISDSFADPKIFNISADAEVNSYIENLPKDGVAAEYIGRNIGKHLHNGLGTKKYYEEIQDYLNRQQQAQAQNPQKPCNGGQGGQQDSQQSSSSPSEATPDESQKDDKQKDSQTPPPPPQDKPEPKEPKDDDKDSQEEAQGQPEKGNENRQEPAPQQEGEYPEEFEDVFKSYDSHSTWKDFKDMPEATQQLMQNNINAVIKATAEQVEKMHGTIPGEFVEIVERLREKKPEVFNWKAYFRRLLGSIYDVNIKSTRRKPSKRFEESAGIQHRKKVSILVAVDTSGSVSQSELQEFFSEIDYVYKAGARVTILQCDTRINSVDEYDGKNIPTILGRGGTDFNPPVDYYTEHKKEYASLIYFTDGYCSLPTRNPQGMVWVITSNGCHQDYPGKAIYIPKNNSNT